MFGKYICKIVVFFSLICSLTVKRVWIISYMIQAVGASAMWPITHFFLRIHFQFCRHIFTCNPMPYHCHVCLKMGKKNVTIFLAWCHDHYYWCYDVPYSKHLSQNGVNIFWQNKCNAVQIKPAYCQGCVLEELFVVLWECCLLCNL